MSYNNLNHYMDGPKNRIVEEAKSAGTEVILDPMERERIERLGPGDLHPSVMEHDLSDLEVSSHEGDLEVKGREGEIAVAVPDDKKYSENSPDYKKTETGKNKTENEENDTKRIVNSNIISASINSREDPVHNLPEPIYYTLEHKTVGAFQ